MTLPEICEPLFQYICRLNRSSGGQHSHPQVRQEVQALLKQAAAASSADPRLAGSFEEIRTALVFFVDFMIANGHLPFAAEWNENRLAYEMQPPRMVGDQEFFDLLESALQDRHEGAESRLVVYYTCIGLGFTGMYFDQPAYLRRKMHEIKARLEQAEGMGASGQSGMRICPEAYEHVDSRNLIQKPTRPLWAFGVALAGMAIVLLVANVVLFRDSSAALNRALESISAGQADASPAGEGGVK